MVLKAYSLLKIPQLAYVTGLKTCANLLLWQEEWNMKMQITTLWINILSLLEYLQRSGISETENSEMCGCVSFHTAVTLV